jgi:hypothetical protein
VKPPLSNLITSTRDSFQYVASVVVVRNPTIVCSAFSVPSAVCPPLSNVLIRMVVLRDSMRHDTKLQTARGGKSTVEITEHSSGVIELEFDLSGSNHAEIHERAIGIACQYFGDIPFRIESMTIRPGIISISDGITMFNGEVKVVGWEGMKNGEGVKSNRNC